ncbi:MAG TPA: SDR family NAD(P)-dependent oxidoreductase [Acidimicrobiia bacterium]|nr:SDR family NAD(P)-dependent oxidoreductase [Acidimicrobiia bacterium]
MDTISFDDQVAVITGAGGGLGKTYALELARRGAKVVVNDLGGAPDGTGSASSPAEDTVAEIKAAGGEAVACFDSVATPEGGQAIIDAALANFGRVDIVINNAGILRDKSFANMALGEINAVLDVHLKGAFFVSQPAFRHMKAQGYGRFLHTTSAAGLFGNFGQTNYSAAKAGLLGLSSTIAIEGAKAGITSNVIAPLARTRLTDELLGPMGEKLGPEHVTAMAVFLVSKDCPLTHEVFAAGAGWFGRVFIGMAPGAFPASGGTATAEDIRDHLREIRAEDGYIVPLDANAAVAPMAKVLGL